MTTALDRAIWTVTDNADWSQPLVFTDRNGAPYDLTGSTFRADFKADRDDVAAVISLTTANGGVASTDLANGAITLNLADFALSPGSYVGDLIRIAGGGREHMLDIELEVFKGVTGI